MSACPEYNQPGAIRQKWKLAARDIRASSSNPESDIDAASLSMPATVKNVAVTASGQRADFWGNCSTDGHLAFMTTQSRYGSECHILNEGGELICLRVDSWKVKWRYPLSQYTNSPGTISYSTPAVFGRYLYLATSHHSPQSFKGSDGCRRRIFNIESGSEVKASGCPPCLLCVDKESGILKWSARLGNEAKSYLDHDNNSIVTGSPIVVKIKQGKRSRLVVATGTDSVQSRFPLENSFLSNRCQKGSGTLPIYLTQNRVHTDVGRVIFHDAETGERIAMTRMGPCRYVEGHVLDNDAPVEKGGGFLYPGKKTFTVYRYLSASDIERLQKDIPRYFAGPQLLVTSLFNECGHGKARVPEYLNGVTVTDNEGQSVTLTGGQHITSNLDGCTVSVSSIWVKGERHFEANGNLCNFSRSMIGVRVYKHLRDGDRLDEADAYYANYYGAGLQGFTPSITLDEEEEHASFLCCTTGQAQQVPAEDELVLGDNKYDPRPFYQQIKNAQLAYINDPSEANLDLVNVATGTLNESQYSQSLVKVSPRAARFLQSSIVVISLGDNLGSVVSSQKASAHSVWQEVYSLQSSGKTTDCADKPLNKRALVTDIEAYSGFRYSLDTGLRDGCSLSPRSDLSTLAVSATRDGNILAVTLEKKGKISDVRKVRAAFASHLPGYGSCSTSTAFLTTQPNVPFPSLPFPANQTGFLYPVAVSWISSSIDIVPSGQSYLCKFDLFNLDLGWISPFSAVSPVLASSSCNRDLIFTVDGAGQLTVNDIGTGQNLANFPLKTPGISRPVLIGNSLIVCGAVHRFSPYWNWKGCGASTGITVIYFQQPLLAHN